MSDQSQHIRQLLEEAGAFWLYQGEPRKEFPHALLTSGLHSDGYVNVGQVLKEQPTTRNTFAKYILWLLRQEGCKYSRDFDRVVGADTSSTGLAGDIARIVDAVHIKMVKTEDEKGKRQVWHEGNVPLMKGEIILHIEELLTTSSSALLVREGIRSANPEVKVRFLHFLPVVVERSNPDKRVTRVEESLILPLLQLSIRNYEPNLNACPYCAAGSEALRPKEDDNWLRLTSKS